VTGEVTAPPSVQRETVTRRIESNLIAIVVPTSSHAVFSADEEISLRHLAHFLGTYDRYFVSPKGLTVTRPGFATESFPTHCFGNARAHNRLMFSTEFFERFRRYRYILMYHLDALVLSDQLVRWCETDLDLIGAPWLYSEDSPWVDRPRVGNGGFALMKIESHLKVLRSTRRAVDPEEYWRSLSASTSPWRRWLHLPQKYLKRLSVLNNVRWEMRRWPGNCDLFWSDEAVRYWPDFRVASVEQGLEFAFEASPRMCFELNHRRLPFGCHAWARYDRAFWEPYLLR
jgi:hypothetical protein